MRHLRMALALAAAVLVGTALTAQTPEKAKLKPDILMKIQEALPDKAPAKPKQARKVLIFSKTDGFRHGSIGVGAVSLTMLGEKTGAYTAVHSEDDALFEPDTLKQFDAVLMLNTTNEIFLPKDKEARSKPEAKDREERLKASLVSFVKGGKGLAGIHAATDTYKNWGEYNMMMGGAFASHPWTQMVPVKNLVPGHPLNAMFTVEGFQVNDEIYQFRDHTALPTDRRMLLAMDTAKMNEKDVKKGGRKDGQYPISWVSKYGKGRTFYCSLGHRDEIYWNPLVLKHYLAGLQYALGDLEADATPTAAAK